MSAETAARLAACGIELAARQESPEKAGRQYAMFVRGNCMALVQTAGDQYISVGSAGMMTENGLAYLMWSEGRPRLASHGHQADASAEQVAAIRTFSEDLKASLGI